MKRRQFIGAAAAASAIPLTGMAHNNAHFSPAEEKELFEIRTYEIKFRADQQLLFDYLENALKKSLKKIGVDHLIILQEYGVSDPKRIRVFINYPNAESFMKAYTLNSDTEYVKMAAEYNALSVDKALYERFESSLLLAFDGMPQMRGPIDGASLFELRTYEGYSEDAVRRKIKMFNEGEIDIFLKTGLHPVFFGEMIIGPYRPCLTYMLNFKDMQERDANWAKFISHPEWKAMSGLDEYANTVSQIRRIFLKPL